MSDNAGSGSNVDCDSKEIQIPRNDLIRGRRTGIIITLLPISSETVETGDEEKRKNGQVEARERERDRRPKERKRKTRRGKRTNARKKRDKDHVERFALGTRYIDRP